MIIIWLRGNPLVRESEGLGAQVGQSNKRQFSVFVYMSAACGFAKRRCKYKEKHKKIGKRKNCPKKSDSSFLENSNLLSY